MALALTFHRRCGKRQSGCIHGCIVIFRAGGRHVRVVFCGLYPQEFVQTVDITSAREICCSCYLTNNWEGKQGYVQRCTNDEGSSLVCKSEPKHS